jgi:integrase
MLVLFAADAKTREARKIPLTGPLKKIIERRRARRIETCKFVFHKDGKSFWQAHGGLPIWAYRCWHTACAAVGLDGLFPYDLRRSVVRNLVRAGVPVLSATRVTGHKPSQLSVDT